MALRYEAELWERLSRLVGELSPLGSVCVVGFSGDAALVAKALAQVQKDGRWDYADLRAADAKAALAATTRLVSAKVVVLALRPDNLSLATSAFIAAPIDKNAAVNLGDGVLRPRSSAQSFYLLVEGCPPFAEAPRELQRVPYWDVIP